MLHPTFFLTIPSLAWLTTQVSVQISPPTGSLPWHPHAGLSWPSRSLITQSHCCAWLLLCMHLACVSSLDYKLSEGRAMSSSQLYFRCQILSLPKPLLYSRTVIVYPSGNSYYKMRKLVWSTWHGIWHKGINLINVSYLFLLLVNTFCGVDGRM